MTNLAKAWGKQNGDCHEIAAAIMLDIAIGTWVWYTGRCPRIGSHSWIETDGWAIDASTAPTSRLCKGPVLAPFDPRFSVANSNRFNWWMVELVHASVQKLVDRDSERG